MCIIIGKLKKITGMFKIIHEKPKPKPGIDVSDGGPDGSGLGALGQGVNSDVRDILQFNPDLKTILQKEVVRIKLVYILVYYVYLCTCITYTHIFMSYAYSMPSHIYTYLHISSNIPYAIYYTLYYRSRSTPSARMSY